MDARPLRLLSLGRRPESQTFAAEALICLDGGGVKGLTSLLLLKEIFRALENQGYSVQPHEYFDLIGGTSTGGCIFPMLMLSYAHKICLD